MRAYRAIFSARCRTLLQYRAAAVAGLGTQVFFGFVRVMVFEAFYGVSTATQPMSLPDAITYVWLGQATLLIVMYGVDTDVRNMVQSGTVAYELLRPIDLYGLWYMRAVALRTAPVLLRAVPLCAIAGLFFGLQAPPSVACAALFLVSIVCAVLLTSATGTLMTISLLWTVSGEGVQRLMPAAIFVGSGFILPLPLWPDWIQPVFNFLPFRGMGDVPYRLYTGNIPPEQGLFAIAHQLAWTLAFVALGRWLLRRGTRRLVVQGG